MTTVKVSPDLYACLTDHGYCADDLEAACTYDLQEVCMHRFVSTAVSRPMATAASGFVGSFVVLVSRCM